MVPKNRVFGIKHLGSYNLKNVAKTEGPMNTDEQLKM